MSAKELARLTILCNVANALISKVKASALLRLSPCQISRLLAKIQEQGPAGIIAGKRQTKQQGNIC